MRVTQKTKEKILDRLAQEYQNTTTALQYSNHFELLIAVILSAQCTDVRVNVITARLYPRYNSPEAMLMLSQEQLEELIRDCGLYRAKAKNILATCRILVDKYSSQVPNDFNRLVELPGVGRKTANVILSQLFDQPAIAVDTHVFRVANRLELAKGDTPLAVEQGLMKVIPRENWGKAHHWLIWHGRTVCKARRPECSACVIAEYCASRNNTE